MTEDEMDEFCFLWREYGREDDAKLTKDAISLKQRLITHIQNIPKFEE